MKKMENPIIMHINYFEQGQSIEYICRHAAALGYDGVEFRRARSGMPDETPEQYLDELKKYGEEYGIKYIMFGSPGINVMTQDEAVRRAEIDKYKRFLELADKRIKLSVINFMTGPLSTKEFPGYEYEKHGSGCAEDWHWENAAEACREVADFAPHVKFAFETHMNYLHDLAESAKKLCDLIDRPNMGVNLDYGNTVYFQGPKVVPIETAIDQCGDKLFYTHLKNSIPGAPRRTPTGLSDGAINHRQYLKKLQAVGFVDGFIGIEAPRPGDREWFAAEDLAYVKALIKNCNEG